MRYWVCRGRSRLTMTPLCRLRLPWKFQYGGTPVEGVHYVRPEGLLGSTDLRPDPPDGDGEERDVLALIFWMGSRMEESCATASRDAHGRFDPMRIHPHGARMVGHTGL